MTAQPPQAVPSDGECFDTSDGRRFQLRPIHPTDAAALLRAFDRLTPEQIRLRVFHRMGSLSPRLAAWLCAPDPATAAAFVVLGDDGEIRGDGRFYLGADGRDAEFGVIVDPACTGIGVGSALMRHLLAEARARGVAELWGLVLVENSGMLELARQLGARREPVADEPGVLRVAFDLRQGPASPDVGPA